MRIAVVISLTIFVMALPAETTRDQLKKQAQTAFDREMAREKAGDCPKAVTTLAISQCLSGEVDTSEANYKSYVGALRAMLAQQGDPPPDENGPTGKPLTVKEKLANFDRVEATWSQYRDAMCAASVGLYKGGTIVHILGGTCQLMMLRSHMREMNNVYGEYFSH